MAARAPSWIRCIAFGVATTAVCIASGAVSRCLVSKPPDTTGIAQPAPAVLIIGRGGATWANGSMALASRGVLTWACQLSASQLYPAGGATALVEEDTATVLAWHPHGMQHRVSLSQLRRPVACRQVGELLYVACFGIEGEAGRAGIATIDVGDWTVVRERVLGTHVHNIYPAPSGRLFFADVGDPWVDPPALGGLFHIDQTLEGRAARVGPPCHARAASIPAGLFEADAAAPATLDTVHVVTQQPFGHATRVHALSAERQVWQGLEEQSPASVVTSQTLELPLPARPADGGADIFRLGGRLFCTDRYGGPGRLFELALPADEPPEQADGPGTSLKVIASVELGVQPRYTVPLSEPLHADLGEDEGSTIFSVSTLDGLLTAVEVVPGGGLKVVARQPANVPMPSFLIVL